MRYHIFIILLCLVCALLSACQVRQPARPCHGDGEAVEIKARIVVVCRYIIAPPSSGERSKP